MKKEKTAKKLRENKTIKEKVLKKIKELEEVDNSIIEKENAKQKLMEEIRQFQDQINYLKVGKAKIKAEIEALLQ